MRRGARSLEKVSNLCAQVHGVIRERLLMRRGALFNWVVYFMRNNDIPRHLLVEKLYRASTDFLY